MHPRLQGDFGELSAAMWLTSQGAKVSKPIGHCPDHDLVADFGEQLMRVEVKSSRRYVADRWDVATCTRGGNQSWTGITKRFEAKRCDFVIAVVGDGRRWCIPAEAIEGHTSIKLAGPKYSEFEVESGPPLPSKTEPQPPSTIASPLARGDTQAVNEVAL